MTLYFFDGYPVDAILNSDDTAESDVTDFEVEDGVDFTDHIRNKPREVTFTVVVSDSPLAEVLVARGGAVDGVSFSAEAIAFFEAMRDNRQPVTIEAPLRTYDRMGLTSLGEPMDIDDGDSQRFIVSFKELRVTKTTRSTVTLPRAKGPKRGGTAVPITRTILAVNKKTGKFAYYFPDQKKFYDPDTLTPLKDPSGFTPLKYDDASGRWLDPSTGKPFQNIPQSAQPFQPTTGPQSGSPSGFVQGQYDPFWDSHAPGFLNGAGVPSGS